MPIKEEKRQLEVANRQLKGANRQLEVVNRQLKSAKRQLGCGTASKRTPSSSNTAPDDPRDLLPGYNNPTNQPIN